MCAKLSVNLKEGVIDVEGTDEFVKELYQDMKSSLVDELARRMQPNKIIDAAPSKKLESGVKEEKTRKSSSKRAAKNTKSKTLSPGIEQMEINPFKDGLPSYRTVKKKGDRILWILAYAVEHNFDELQPVDVEYIADKLRDDITTRSIRALADTANQKGYFKYIKGGAMKILQTGIDYIKTVSETKVEQTAINV